MTWSQRTSFCVETCLCHRSSCAISDLRVSLERSPSGNPWSALRPIWVCVPCGISRAKLKECLLCECYCMIFFPNFVLCTIHAATKFKVTTQLGKAFLLLFILFSGQLLRYSTVPGTTTLLTCGLWASLFTSGKTWDMRSLITMATTLGEKQKELLLFFFFFFMSEANCIVHQTLWSRAIFFFVVVPC